MAFLHAALTKERVRVAQLAELYEKFGQSGSFLQELIAEIEMDDEETLASSAWLLRRYVKDRPEIPAKALEVALEIMSNSPNWVVRLHLGQIFSLIDCPPNCRDTLLEFFCTNAAYPNAFVRAWALTALYRLKTKVPAEDRRAIERVFKKARTDTAKCVQARLRQLNGKNQANSYRR